jgi:hypothetical protein
VIQTYPEVASKVVHTHHAGVWSGERLDPSALRQMLDASITELTGLHDATEAWSALFKPGERVAIKVNTFYNSLLWTHAPLVMAITDALQDAGLGAEQIVIYDCLTSELETAGYPVNKDGAGVRCYGNDGDHVGDWKIVGRRSQISRILTECDALINVPVLKAHRLAGLSFAMKNHYGTISNPSRYHRGQAINQGMAEINALPPIRDRTRLIVGDMLAACLHYGASYPYWEADWEGDALLMSFDPVAHDTVGLDIIANLRESEGGSGQPLVDSATPWLSNGAKMGLGADAPDNIDLVEMNL